MLLKQKEQQSQGQGMSRKGIAAPTEVPRFIFSFQLQHARSAIAP
jgi:hypothetical protein